METTFARWLTAKGEAHYAFANRFGINKEGVARLAGIARSPRPTRFFKRDFLTLVSGETGIPIETLIEDATKAAANPTPPRRYQRRIVDTEDIRERVDPLAGAGDVFGKPKGERNGKRTQAAD